MTLRAPRTPSAAPASLPPVHLRSIRLRGFKSFPDALELKLEPGVAVVVGPNGSGKSNVADAIVWAAGSLAPSELRAEKPDDVLFNGAEGRTAAETCEVELIFDNESGAFGELDFSEVSIARRLHRGGEGQYLVNKAQVRRTDLVELLADVGLSGSMHSIVSQGKVEAVLASKPDERRELVEEAAGLGKFKRRRHRAELKLNRVAIQVERARDVEAEVRKRLRPLALQATAAERAEKLAEEIVRLRARIAQLDLAAADARREARRSARPPPGSHGAARRRSCRHCSPSGTPPRRSSPTRPGVGRPRSRRSTGFNRRASGSRSGRKARKGCSCGSAPTSARQRRPRPSTRRSRRSSSSGRLRRRRRRARGSRGERCRSRACPRGPGAARSLGARRRVSGRGAARRSAHRAARDRDRAGRRRGRTRGCDRGALPARHRSRADRDAERVGFRAARPLSRRAGRGRGRGEAPRVVAGGARSRRERGDRRRARRGSFARRPPRARVSRQGAARGARALARGA